MFTDLEFVRQYEKYSIVIKGFHQEGEQKLEIFLDFPVVLQDISGAGKKLRYDSYEKKENGYEALASAEDLYGNKYEITDVWSQEENGYKLSRQVACKEIKEKTGIRLTSEFRCRDLEAADFSDYQFIIPGALYNQNDTDGDGMDDYLGTFNQDYKDDRNPSLSVTAYGKKSRWFVSLIRGDLPKTDETITREQIRARHFIHHTDIGSLGISPSEYRTQEFILRCDYPFYERNSFCLNVDGSEWSAYKEVVENQVFCMEYLLYAREAGSLTEASWNTTRLQMQRIMDPDVELSFTLEEAQHYRREMIHNSYREFPDKKGKPAGYFVHFSPRSRYGEQNLLEYGFCGAQTLLSLDMMEAAKENGSEEYRERAVKTVDYFVENCIEESGLPNGIYNVDKEEYVYWWTGILFPFQYSDDRDELEAYLGNQVVSSLMEIAGELRKVKGNYCRSMVDSMHYLLRCYLFEKESGIEHPKWLEAVVKFCDKLLEMQNGNGSWNRGYTMDGKPITNPPQWFGASEKEQGSGAIFPAQILTELYRFTKEEKYLRAAERAAYFVYDNYAGNVEYIGGLNDTTHRKSVKIDAVGVMFAMRTMLVVYEQTRDVKLLAGARDAARILASWTYLWDIPFDKDTLLGKHGFKTTGWAVCDVIPAGSYVDCEFVEFIPELLRIAEYCKDEDLAVLAKIVTRGMQHGLSMPQNMYGYAMPGVQCEGYMTSLWLADTEYKGFSGAAAKNKGDDNDTCNGLVNGQALLNLDYLSREYRTMDFDTIIRQIMAG